MTHLKDEKEDMIGQHSTKCTNKYNQLEVIKSIFHSRNLSTHLHNHTVTTCTNRKGRFVPKFWIELVQICIKYVLL